jgi:hypothetical protein
MYQNLYRQLMHWSQAINRLSVLDHLASVSGWQGVETSLGIALRKSFRLSITRLKQKAALLDELLRKRKDENELETIRAGIVYLREEYLKTETTIHFFTDAINTRTNEKTSALLIACDYLCYQSLAQLLEKIGKTSPMILTYIDKGLGASILKAGLRLWDGGTISPAAAIKVTQHNLFRPTAIIHETGHQMAHITGWNDELATVLLHELKKDSSIVAEAFASWSSEIAADAYAFVFTGYAAVAALHDVLAGRKEMVFQYMPGDPHPISYLRVLLNIECCRQHYGKGPWDELEKNWRSAYRLDMQTGPQVRLIRESLVLLPAIATLVLKRSFNAFQQHSLIHWIDPMNVCCAKLDDLYKSYGDGLYQSHALLKKEALRLLARSGYLIATKENDLDTEYRQQEKWMERLGNLFLRHKKQLINQ